MEKFGKDDTIYYITKTCPATIVKASINRVLGFGYSLPNGLTIHFKRAFPTRARAEPALLSQLKEDRDRLRKGLADVEEAIDSVRNP